MEATNTFGAVVFWLYIIAALYLIRTIIHTIYHLPKSPSAKEPQKPSPTFQSLVQQKSIFISLALISFATLSYNMMSVLINSYTAWSILHNIPHPSSISEFLKSDPPFLSYLSKTYEPRKVAQLYLWQWSTTSTQFQDFGEAIVADPERYFWSGLGLWATFGVMVVVGIYGSTAQMPKLWAFIALAEILPVSFTQNLFYLALLQQQKSMPAKTSATSQPASSSYSTLALLYSVCLYLAPNAGSNLITVIIVARLVLLATALLPLYDNRASNGTSSISLGIWALVLVVSSWTFLQPLFPEHRWPEVLEAINSHPAVSALGHDSLISVVSWLAWRRWGVSSSSQAMSQQQKGQ